MSTKSVSYTFLLLLSFFLVNCHNHDTQGHDAPTVAATEVSQKIEAVKDQTVETASAAKAAVTETMNEAKPTLTAAKETVAASAVTAAEKVKEVATDTKEAVTEKAKEVKEVVKKKAPKKKKKRKRSKIKFEETLHKFGTIKQGEVVKYDFTFKNTGNAPLVIKKVDVSCGCTFPSYPFMPIEPGKEGTIGVTYDSKNKVGHQKPAITVVTNGSPRTLKLNLEGVVE